MTAADREEAPRVLDAQQRADAAYAGFDAWAESIKLDPATSWDRTCFRAGWYAADRERAASTPPSPEPRPYRFPVTDDHLDAPDGAIIDGYQRSGDQWVRLPEPQAETQRARCSKCRGSGSIPNGNYEMACGVCQGTGVAAHPELKPSNAELIATVRAVLTETYDAGQFSDAPAALSELERRLVKP